MMKDKYKVLLISCWILLGICVLIKLFGANIFIAGSNNEIFKSLCDAIQNTFWYYVVGTLFNVLTATIYYMAVLKVKKPDWRWFLIYVVYAIIKTIFYNQKVLFFVLDIFIMILLPIAFNRGIWLRAILAFGINLGFQVISMFLKLRNYTMFDENTLVAIILSVDYIIMLVLFWLYSIDKKKEV